MDIRFENIASKNQKADSSALGAANDQTPDTTLCIFQNAVELLKNNPNIANKR